MGLVEHLGRSPLAGKLKLNRKPARPAQATETRKPPGYKKTLFIRKVKLKIGEHVSCQHYRAFASLSTDVGTSRTGPEFRTY